MRFSVYYYYGVMVLFFSSCKATTQIRLTGGNGTEGRVEVYHNNTWGTICDDLFDTNPIGASVVCRMLKLSWHGTFSPKFRGGTGPIQLDQIQCEGNEFDIQDCAHTHWGLHDCKHTEDVGVICDNDFNYIRLRSLSSLTEGIYEIYSRKSGIWFPLCSDDFDDKDAKVACTSLNLLATGASVVKNVLSGVYSDKMINEKFNCNGNEQQLIKCNSDYKTICKSGRTPVISCGYPNIRLTNGNASTEGKVEISHNGRWGDICATGIEATDATVLCRMLGFDHSRSVQIYSINGSSLSEKHLENLNCNGDEHDLNSCSNVHWKSSCVAGNSLGLKCYNTRVRLRGGPSPFEGRIEVYHNGSWGSICDNSFDNKDALVICRMIGANDSSATTINSAHYGEGRGEILMNDIDCVGTEADIAQCKFNEWGVNNCVHSEDVAVRCNKDFDARLVSNTYNRWEGRLEIKMNGQWGTVNGIQFTPYMADEFCRYLGYNGSTNIYESKKFGKGSYPIEQLENLFGTQYSYTKVPLSHEDDVGISCENTKIRLKGSSNPYEGRVEVLNNGKWGSICCHGFSQNSAEVICKQLGFKGLSSWSANSRYGRTEGKPMWINNLKCTLNENDIAACKSDSWQSASCSNTCNIGVVCEHNNVRLVNGSAPFQGRVEFLHNSQWGSVYLTNVQGVKTICRMLRYNESDVTQFSTYHLPVFGRSSNQVLPATYCGEDEMDINGCMLASKVNWTSSIHPSYNAMARCRLQLRLVNGPSRGIGRVEIMRNKIWGTLCGKGMTEQLATEICKMVATSALSWRMTGTLMKDAFYGKGSGPIWRLRDGCASDVAKCLLPDGEHTDCDHSDDIGVFCNPNMDTRLTGGHREGEGRVELLYNNEWVGMCDTNWDSKDAAAVCRSIGYWGFFRYTDTGI